MGQIVQFILPPHIKRRTEILHEYYGTWEEVRKASKRGYDAQVLALIEADPIASPRN